MKSSYLMRLFVPLFAPLLGLTLVCTSTTNASAASERRKLRSVMHDFYEQLSDLKETLISDERFASKKGQAEIKKALNKVQQQLNELKPNPELKNPSYRITLSVFQDHLNETQKWFDKGRYSYARSLLNATPGLCIQCHTQLPIPLSARVSWLKDSLSKSKQVILKDAEFAFIIRRYERALALYNQLIKDHKKYKLDVSELDQILRRKLVIYARVERNPNKGLAEFKKDLKIKDLPPYVVKNIETWVHFLTEWKNEKSAQKIEKFDDKTLIAYARKKLNQSIGNRTIGPSHPDLVNYLRISGLLYERLHKRPDSASVPEMLYYLGLCEKHLHQQFFYSLSDFYFRECASRYSKSKIAKQCYKQYEESLVYAYTGTTGTKLPKEIEKEIKDLKKKVGL